MEQMIIYSNIWRVVEKPGGDGTIDDAENLLLDYKTAEKFFHDRIDKLKGLFITQGRIFHELPLNYMVYRRERLRIGQYYCTLTNHRGVDDNKSQQFILWQEGSGREDYHIITLEAARVKTLLRIQETN